jgi:hypothetical protein
LNWGGLDFFKKLIPIIIPEKTHEEFVDPHYNQEVFHQDPDRFRWRIEGSILAAVT